MRSILKASLLALAVASVPAVAVVAPAHAQTASSQAAGQFVDQLADRAFAILRDKSLGRDEARRQFRAMLKRSEEHTSELQSLKRISYAVSCLKKKKYKHSDRGREEC